MKIIGPPPLPPSENGTPLIILVEVQHTGQRELIIRNATEV